ncbi:MAG: hypothetical protein H7Y12_15245 [Sphingobacteriaceae bacterium]|nr:hypothetical protein [Cytophagaceae bacterium]
MTRTILFLLDRLQPLFRVLGVDYPILRTIVEVKLTMDNRRNHAVGGRPGQKKTDSNNRFLMVLGVYTLFGVIAGALVFIVPSLLLSTAFLFSYVMFTTALTLISDFSNVLLDTTDNVVILPRPVDGRTLLVARLVHLVTYILLIVLALSLFPTIYIGFKYGPLAAGLFWLLNGQATLLTVFFTTLLYMLLIRLTSEERLKDIISYTQIFITIIFSLSYQILPRLLDFSILKNVDFTLQAWHFAVPPLWLAGSMDAIVNGHFEPGYVLLMGLALVMPLALLFVNSRYLAPAFNRKLAVMGAGSSGGERPAAPERGGFRWSEWLAQRLTRTELERGAFELSWKITSRDRRFKLRTYPSVGVFLPLLFIFVWPVYREKGLEGLADSATYLWMIYIVQSVLSTFYQSTYQSDDFRAAWVYYATPVGSPREVILGNLKAVVMKFFTPFYLAIGFLMSLLWGWRILDDLLAGYLFALVVVTLEAWTKSTWYLPFSQEPKEKQDGTRTMKTMLTLFVFMPTAGLLHWGATFVPGGALLLAALYGGLLWATTKSYERLSWEQFE